jgi:hypothetical protein
MRGEVSVRKSQFQTKLHDLRAGVWGGVAATPSSTGSAEGHVPVEFSLSLESVPYEEGDLFAVHLDAATHSFGDEKPVLSIDLDGHRAPELLFKR